MICKQLSKKKSKKYNTLKKNNKNEKNEKNENVFSSRIQQKIKF